MARKFITVQGYSKDHGIEFEIQLPAIREVCPRCDGDGKHVNPAVDGNGISAEEFEEDPEFREHYLSGWYDVRCELCRGAKVIDVIDEAAIEAKGAPISWRKGWIRHLRWSKAESDYRRECEMERRMGA